MLRKMKHWNTKLLCVIIFTLIFSNCYPTTYYLSNQGSDSNSGKSLLLPWKTLSKLNNTMVSFLPGDSVLLRRGDIFYEKLLVTKSGIAGKPFFIGAYGNGNKPIIHGGKLLNNWTSAGNNIWQANCLECTSEVQALTFNGKMTPMGKYPDDTYLYPDSIISKSTFIDGALNTLPDFTGGEVVARTMRWVLDRGIINSKNQSTLNYTLGNFTAYALGKETYYFLQNHRSFLSRNQEWAYSATDKKIYIYFTSNPTDFKIEISYVDNLVEVLADNVSISDIIVKLSNQNSLKIRL